MGSALEMKAVAGGRGFPGKGMVRERVQSGEEDGYGPWRHDPAKIISVAISPAKIISFRGLPFLGREKERDRHIGKRGVGKGLLVTLLVYFPT